MSNYNKLTENQIYQILKNLAKDNKKLCIFCHVSPDGDCIGSAFALKLIYESLGGKAICVSQDSCPTYIRFLLVNQEDVTTDAISDEYAFCSVDVASVDRLGIYKEYQDRIIFMIDHHRIGNAFADNLIIPDASATAEIIYEICNLIKKDGYTINPTISRLLFAAISSDTGSFRYSNTTTKTLSIVAELMEEINNAKDNGIDTAEIGRLLHDCKSFETLKAHRIALENLHITDDRKIAYICLTKELMAENNIEEGDTGSLVDISRSVEGVSIGLVIKEKDKGIYKLSARSNGNADVAKVCAKFGGGGHTKAAGATVNANSIEEVEKIALEEFNKVL